MELAADAARGVAVTDAAAVDPHQPADGVGAADTARGVAVTDAAAVEPHQLADAVLAANTASNVAIGDGGAVEPHQPADVLLAADTATDQADVANHGALARKAKQTHVVSRWPVDYQLADAVAKAIKCAGKSVG